MPNIRRFTNLVILAGLCLLASRAVGQSPSGAAPKEAKPAPKAPSLRDKLRSPLRRDEPLTEKLRSPREALRTFYFAINTYDRFPEMIEDATVCLDVDPAQTSKEEAAFLALELDKILQHLEIPLLTVPELLPLDKRTVGAGIVIHEGGGFTIGMRAVAPDVWKIDAATLQRLPAMRRLVEERSHGKVDVSGLRDGYTDPRRTMRKFMFEAALGDFYSAARALDLSRLSSDQRREQGPLLAQQLAFVMQRRGFLYYQEIPANPQSAPYTWHADALGRIGLERVMQSDNKEAWQFSKATVQNIAKLYEACKDQPPSERWARYNMIVPKPAQAADAIAAQKRPDAVPAYLGSPRAVLTGFFKTLDAADGRDERLKDVLDYLDLKNIPPEEKMRVGGKLALKLEAVLRKAQIDLASIPEDYNAPLQTLGESRNFKIEIARGRDGCWRFTDATLSRVPAMFETLAAKDRADRERTTYMDSARDTMTTFLTSAKNADWDVAARCLDLSDINAGAREELGPVLAFKLKYVLDSVNHIYVQEIPDEAEGARYTAYHGKLGRIVVARKTDDPGKGQWLFTPETVEQIESLFRQVLQGKTDNGGDSAERELAVPSLADTPGIWLRLRIPPPLRNQLGYLDAYQWIGLGLALIMSLLASYVTLAQFQKLVSWLLKKSGSVLSHTFVAKMLKPLTWLAAGWMFFHMLAWLDLPMSWVNEILPLKKFLLAGLVGWFALRTVDLIRGIYTNSELLKQHRNLSDLVVPVGLQVLKTAVLVTVLAYVAYQVGKGDLLTRFLTGLGVAGLAASLAAQDALKSFFGTLMLISERAFKIGDRILVDGKEGVVEQVGFRSTRLRTNEDSLLTIPNSTIAASSIDNLGMRQARSYRTTILFHHRTALERLLTLRDRLKSWLLDHPLVLRQRVDVRLNKVTELGIEIIVNLFYTPKETGDDTRFQESVTCEILRLAENLQIVLASRLATQTGAEAENNPSRQAA